MSRTNYCIRAAVPAIALLFSSSAFAASTTLVATLSGVNETAGGLAEGSGGFRVEIDLETRDFCYSLWADESVSATMAHVHSGEAGKDGPPAVTLVMTGEDSDECLALEQEVLQPIVDNPAAHYVNIHTAEFPKGALRGQLGKQ